MSRFSKVLFLTTVLSGSLEVSLIKAADDDARISCEYPRPILTEFRWKLETLREKLQPDKDQFQSQQSIIEMRLVAFLTSALALPDSAVSHTENPKKLNDYLMRSYLMMSNMFDTTEKLSKLEIIAAIVENVLIESQEATQREEGKKRIERAIDLFAPLTTQEEKAGENAIRCLSKDSSNTEENNFARYIVSQLDFMRGSSEVKTSIPSSCADDTFKLVARVCLGGIRFSSNYSRVFK
jgi:hypothetical protein